MSDMTIVAAVFIENIELRPAPGPSTRIDLTGVHFSMAAPGPVPCAAGSGGSPPPPGSGVTPRPYSPTAWAPRTVAAADTAAV